MMAHQYTRGDTVMNTQILSSITGEPVAVRFAMVGKGKALHYSPSNDETLCGKIIRAYVDANDHEDAPMCKRCARIDLVKSGEYAEWLKGQENGSVQGESKTETVNVVQNTPGMSGVNHYHAPGCRDIEREMKRWGQSNGDAYVFSFSSVAEIISHEFGDANGHDVYDMISHANEKFDGLRIMPCLSISMGELNSAPLVFVNGKWALANEKYDNGSWIDPECGCVRFADPAEVPCPDHLDDVDGPMTGQYDDYDYADEESRLRALEEDDQSSYAVPSHTRYPHGRSGPEDTTAVTEVFEPSTRVISRVTGDRGTVIQPYMTGVIESTGTRMAAVTLEMDNGARQSALIGDLMLTEAHTLNQEEINEVMADFRKNGDHTECVKDSFTGQCLHDANHTDLRKGVFVQTCLTCGESKQIAGPWNVSVWKCANCTEPVSLVNDGISGSMDELVTQEYHLSVTVEAGVRVDLGWHTFTVNASHVDDDELIAELYGERHGSGSPRGGWASIITVMDVCDL
jgi:hypothetical protein